MSMKHTPGPWGTHFHAAHGHCITRINEHGHPMSNDIAVVFMAHDGRTREEAKANARLIAAAPELLAALEWAVEYADNSPPSLEGLHTWADIARKAIAKATGEQS